VVVPFAVLLPHLCVVMLTVAPSRHLCVVFATLLFNVSRCRWIRLNPLM
jgi:hypothetical protein